MKPLHREWPCGKSTNYWAVGTAAHVSQNVYNSCKSDHCYFIHSITHVCLKLLDRLNYITKLTLNSAPVYNLKFK